MESEHYLIRQVQKNWRCHLDGRRWDAQIELVFFLDARLDQLLNGRLFLMEIKEQHFHLGFPQTHSDDNETQWKPNTTHWNLVILNENKV